MNQPAPIHHNNPPSELDLLKEKLATNYQDKIKETEEIIKEAENFLSEFDNEESANLATDYIHKTNKLFKQLEKDRVAEKEPFFECGKEVDSYFKILKEKITKAEEKVRVPLTKWLNAKALEEKQRRDAEAAKLAKEAAEAAAKALEEKQRRDAETTEEKQPEKVDFSAAKEAIEKAETAEQMANAPISRMAFAGGSSGVSSLKSKWVGEVVNRNTIDLEVLREHLSLNAIQIALNSYVKEGGRTLTGAKIYEQNNVKVK